MRVFQHIIDTMAIKATLNSIPHHWVVRDLSERDYGIDMMTEIFRKDGSNKYDHDFYEATGEICYLQLKGTSSGFEYNDDNTLSYSLDKKTLLYVEKFSTPFILLRVSVAEGQEKIHFVWLQRYIMEVLDFQIPDWRELQRKAKGDEEEKEQESYTIRIPKSNILPVMSPKIERIASRIKYIEEHAEFHERFTNIKLYLQDIIERGLDFPNFNHLQLELNRISRFATLFAHNNCCIDQGCVNDLSAYLLKVEQGSVTPENLESFPHHFNLSLLYDESMYRISMDTFLADHIGDTAY
jgi:hypothetical protein